MPVTISIDNDRSTPLVFDPLILDQSAGVQDNDVALDFTDTADPNDPLVGALFDSSFLGLVNTLSATQLTEAQKIYAATVKGAVSNADFVQVNVTGGDVVSDLFFSGAGGAPLEGVLVTGMTTLAGEPIYLWAAANSDFAIATTSNVSATDGRVVAAFYLKEAPDHLTAQVQMITFEAIDHPINPNPDDFLNFTDVLKVSAASTLTFSFDELDSGNFLYAAFGTTSAGIVLTGEDLNVNDTLKQNGTPSQNFGEPVSGGSDGSDVLNTGQGGDGATIGINAQDIRPGGGTAVVTFVTGFIPLTGITDGSTFGEDVRDILYDDYINTTSASVFLSQLVSNDAASLTISLWEAGGNNTSVQDPSDNDPANLVEEEGYGPIPNPPLDNTGYIGDDDTDVQLKNDWPVPVASVTITRNGIDYTWTSTGGEPASPPTYQGVVLDVTFSGNSFTVVGLAGFDEINFTAANDPNNQLDGTFNRIKIEGEAGHVDIGAISLSQGTTSSQSVGDLLRDDDDGPSVTAAPSTAFVRHDETAGVQADTDVAGSDFISGGSGPTVADQFINVPSPGDDPDVPGTGAIGFSRSVNSLLTVGGSNGTDGGGSPALAYSISVVNDTYSGVQTTGGTQIFMYNGTGAAAGLVFGRVGTEAGGTDTPDASGTIAFALAVNSATGEVYLVQYLSLLHPTPGASHDETITLADGAVQMAATRTDGDGDSVTDGDNNIGLLIKFDDDGPSLTAETNNGASVRHDETAGVQADTDVAGTDFISGGAGPTVASLFTNVPSPGDDPDVAGTGAIGFSRSVNSLLTVTGGIAGADGGVNPAVNYAISVSNGIYSGVSTTSGTQIFLYNGTGAAAGLVLGRVGTEGGGTDTANPTGTVAFALAVNPATGEVFLAQYLSLFHPTPGASHDETITLAEGSVQMSATRTDGDGDTVTDGDNNIGLLIKFDDDGPTITAVPSATASVRHDETPGVQADTDVAGSAFISGGSGPTVASLFTNVPSPGDDLDVAGTGAIGFARSTNPLVTVTGGSAGADGGASPEVSYAISVVDGALSGVSTTGGTQIFLYNGTGAAAGLVLGRVGTEDGASDDPDPNGTVAFALAVNSATGEVFQAQYLSLLHPTPGASHDETITLLEGAVQMSATRTDGDADTATDGDNNIGLLIKFDDDGPSANGDAQTGTVDEDGTPLNGGLAGGTNDHPTATKEATGNVSAIFDTGADGLGAYLISDDAAKIALLPSLTSQGGTVVYNVNTVTNVLTAYVEVSGVGYNAADDREVFTLSLNSTTGAYSFLLIDQLDHAAPPVNTSDENDLTLNLGAVLYVSDGDGDTAFAAADKLVMTVDDDSPVINSLDSANDITYNNSDNPTPGGSGVFSYSIGFDDRDSYSSSSSDLLVSLLSGTVGSAVITNPDVDWVSETDLQATFNFSFTYVSNPISGSTTNASGTLIFDKDDGTYSISLTAPIVSFSILTLADEGVGFTGYETNSSTTDNSQPAVSVAALADDFFVQFTGKQETGGGTDGNNAGQQANVANNHNLDALAPGEAWSNGDDDAFTAGELFTQSASWVSVSGEAAGVAGDTMQSGEVLDFNFWKENPEGFLNPAGIDQGKSSTIFIEFDGLDNNEDLVVVLKLQDKTDPSITTTRIVIVEYDDIFHKAQANQIPASFGFTGTLDNNDGLVVIESNDYNINPGDNWTITGAQVLASTEGVSGSGINLNRAIGDNGGSPATLVNLNTTQDSGQSNGGTWDGDVFKIVNIGFLTEITPDSELNFGVRVIDYDGDTTGQQTLAIDIEGDGLSALFLNQNYLI
jgi:hypothetical protein